MSGSATVPVLTADNLAKSYGGGFRLGPASMALAPGETVGILGRNGAGKTTLFQLLTGNLDATEGQIRLGDRRLSPDTPELKRRLGYLPQNPVLPRWAGGVELLGYGAALYGLAAPQRRAREAAERWDCAGYGAKPLQTLSYGMQKRVALALATLHDPEVLILDEPFSGLDLFHIKTLEDEIKRRSQTGRVTLLSTHVASFCAELCQRAFIVAAGQLTMLDGWESQDASKRVRAIEEAFFGKGGLT